MVLRDCHINCKNVKKKCANLRETTDNHTSKHVDRPSQNLVYVLQVIE